MSRSDAEARLLRAAACAALALALGGCVETALRDARQPFDYGPLAEPPRPAPTEGAIYPGYFASGSFLSFDRKARGVGDLVTVVVSERSRASSDAATRVESDSSVSARLRSDVGFQDLVAKPIGEILGLLLAADRRNAPAGTDLEVVDAATVNDFDGSGTTSRGGRFDAVITCRVVAELPNNVLHVRGRRSIVVNHELQYMTVEGLVRREDIGIDNVVLSSALGDARITIDGLGVIDDKQRPGWLARMLAWTLPF
jgi:flagellar L-ring protein precursor FlgH